MHGTYGSNNSTHWTKNDAIRFRPHGRLVSMTKVEYFWLVDTTEMPSRLGYRFNGNVSQYGRLFRTICLARLWWTYQLTIVWFRFSFISIWSGQLWPWKLTTQTGLAWWIRLKRAQLHKDHGCFGRANDVVGLGRRKKTSLHSWRRRRWTWCNKQIVGPFLKIGASTKREAKERNHPDIT